MPRPKPTRHRLFAILNAIHHIERVVRVRLFDSQRARDAFGALQWKIRRADS